MDNWGGSQVYEEVLKNKFQMKRTFLEFVTLFKIAIVLPSSDLPEYYNL
jgi:hypothetical protein